jgi:hypothetical protein
MTRAVVQVRFFAFRANSSPPYPNLIKTCAKRHGVTASFFLAEAR